MIQKVHSLDPHSSRNQHETFNRASIQNFWRRRPCETSSHANGELRAQNFFNGSPQPLGGGVLALLHSQLEVGWRVAAAAAASRGRSGFVWGGSDGESTCLADRGEECIYPLAWEELFEKKMEEN